MLNNFLEWECSDCNNMQTSEVCQRCITAVIEQIKTRKTDDNFVLAFLVVALENNNTRFYAKTLLEMVQKEFCDCCCHSFPSGVINHMLACCNGACQYCKRGIGIPLEEHEQTCKSRTLSGSAS